MGTSTNGILFYGLCIDENLHNEENILKLADKTYGDEIFIDFHCSEKYRMYYVAAQKSHTNAYRGTPVEIENLDINPKWKTKIIEFCNKNRIPVTKIGWYLTSYWG